MAWLKKYISKYEYMLISGIWTAMTVYIPSHFNWQADTITLLVTVGNLVIAYLAVGTDSTKEKSN